MTMTLPYRRQQVTPRSGGRIAGDRRAAMEREYGSGAEYETVGTAAVAPKRVGQPEPVGRPTLPRLRVAPPAPVSVPRAPFIAMMLVVVIAGVVGILVLNTKINENAFRLDALQRNQQTLDRTEDGYNRQLANFESPSNLAAAARRLGLVPADSPAFIKLPDGKILGVPRPASGKPSASGTATQQKTGTGG
jgi:hypothetical protein